MLQALSKQYLGDEYHGKRSKAGGHITGADIPTVRACVDIPTVRACIDIPRFVRVSPFPWLVHARLVRVSTFPCARLSWDFLQQGPNTPEC